MSRGKLMSHLRFHPFARPSHEKERDVAKQERETRKPEQSDITILIIRGKDPKFLTEEVGVVGAVWG